MSEIRIDENAVPIYHSEALVLIQKSSNIPSIQRTAAARENIDLIVDYIDSCQHYKSDVAAENAAQAIASFNSTAATEVTSDIHSAHPALTPIEASQILSLGLFTVEKACLITSINDRFVYHKDELQVLLDELASLSK